MRYAFILAAFFLLGAVLAAGQTKKPKGPKSMTETGETPGATNKETAVIETSLGKIEIALFPADAPKTVENFTTLAQKK